MDAVSVVFRRRLHRMSEVVCITIPCPFGERYPYIFCFLALSTGGKQLRSLNVQRWYRARLDECYW